MSKDLHIVCLDCPSPADYGGAIDMFYRIKALYEAGVRIHLHYFSYNNRKPDKELNTYCASINTYQRKKSSGFLSGLPHIVSSRMNEALIRRLNKDNFPVLLEGVHCTGIISQLKPERKTIVRMHNDEHEYYNQLGLSTGIFLKNLYYKRESRLLKKYQQLLPQHCIYACITEKDANTFKKEYGLQNVFFLPPFTPFCNVTGEEGFGDYCLYHANLSIVENEKAALWLIREVFSRIKIKLVIAGKNPSRKLENSVEENEKINIVANPDSKTMNELISNAHINVLPSFSTTGIKLKLLQALFTGRHCVVNNEMIAGTGLEAACHTGSNAEAFASIIMQLKRQPFTNEEIMLRKKLLLPMFDNSRNASELMKYL